MIVIDASDNTKETMLLNAQYAGFTEREIEILSEEEFKAITPELFEKI